MKDTLQSKIQFWVLVLISVFFLLGAPSVWYYTPDGGIYIGTAESMVETGQYRFNGYPNLLYYPGFSVLLSLPIALFGMNFHVLHIFCAGIVVALLWMTRAYFTPDRYGLVGILVPILIACTGVLQQQVFHILSDGAFLAVIMGALLLWRFYEEKSYWWAFTSCLVLVAFSPMVRFQGLFVCLAFAIGLFLKLLRKDGSLGFNAVKGLGMGIAGGALTVIPFIAWTWRNVQQFTPDTFNMANGFFFGQKGLALYAPGFGRVEWIDAQWKYGIYNLAYSIRDLGINVFGGDIVRLVDLKVVIVFLGGLWLIGSLKWFKKATGLEQGYVALSLGFLTWSSLRSGDLYVVIRYWLPVLPFLIVTGGLGLGIIHRKLQKTKYQALFTVFIGLLVVLVLNNGFSRFFKAISQSTVDHYRHADQVMQEAKNFMDKEAMAGASVASTDWGVIPFYLNRKCYQILDDETHVLTLERMKKYGTKYLVILDGMFFSRYARKMVDQFPEIFTLLMEAKPDGRGPTASVYKVDLKELYLFLDGLGSDR